ncbi:hypothetical protein [Pseudomonas sp.]|uniref:hypothetical protein n=1 Tax=Pseudomonas sp. TaxID=306 RepID=UPI0028B25625|nr:hypothetical protein [Pseudomonas sp.]
MNDQATPSDHANDEPSTTHDGKPAADDNTSQGAQRLPEDDDPGLDEAMSDVAVVDSVTAEHPGEQ